MNAVSERLDSLSVDAELWYAIQMKYRTERRVVAALQNKGIETFLPLLEETHNWSDRRQAVRTPLFSGYGFVRLYPCLASRLRVLRTEGVVGFVNFGGEDIPIPVKQIEDLRMMLSHKVPCALHAFLKIGQRVRIRGGCLNGLEGILEHSGAKNLVISIESIQRSVAMTIEGYELELV